MQGASWHTVGATVYVSIPPYYLSVLESWEHQGDSLWFSLWAGHYKFPGCCWVWVTSAPGCSSVTVLGSELFIPSSSGTDAPTLWYFATGMPGHHPEGIGLRERGWWKLNFYLFGIISSGHTCRDELQAVFCMYRNLQFQGCQWIYWASYDAWRLERSKKDLLVLSVWCCLSAASSALQQELSSSPESLGSLARLALGDIKCCQDISAHNQNCISFTMGRIKLFTNSGR